MIIVQASNIHTGGGAVLLKEVLQSLDRLAVPCTVFIDTRFPAQTFNNIIFKPVTPRILNRLAAEWHIRGLAKQQGSIVLCFGNLPPLFSLKSHVVLFFQNVILLDKYNYFSFSWKTRLKHTLERLWLKWGIGHVDRVFVQSENVRRAFQGQFSSIQTEVVAFAQSSEGVRAQSPSQRNGFVYVASADPHKNHRTLFHAWKILGEMKAYPRLILTTQSFDASTAQVYQEALDSGAQIQFLPDLKHAEVLSLYHQAEALIFPSLAESFGLPLIEAQQAGLPIIASELDYVRDVVEPVETFDPQSALSIARAVVRFMKKATPYRTQVVDANSFVKEVMRS